MPIDFSLELFIPDHWVKIEQQEKIDNALNCDIAKYHTICSPEYIVICCHDYDVNTFYDDSMVAVYDKELKRLYVDPKSEFWSVVHQNDN